MIPRRSLRSHRRRQPRRRPAPVGRRVLAAVAALAVAVALGTYLGPRLVDLAHLPGELDGALAAAGRYNPGLRQVVELERGTVVHMQALDDLAASVRQLQAVSGQLDDDLAPLVARLEGELGDVVDLSVDHLEALRRSVEAVAAGLRTLRRPVSGAEEAISGATRALEQLLGEARSVRHDVHRSRVATAGTADNVGGRR